MKLLLQYQIRITVLLLMGTACGYAQSDFPVNTSALQKINPNIHGINLNSKAGVVFSNINYGEGTSAENNYLYGNIAFQDLNFSIGVDVNSFSLNQFGLKQNNLRLSYAYNFKVGYESYFIGGVDVGVTSQIIDQDVLVFQDQLNAQLGTIIGSSIDPLAKLKPSTNYFEIGASGLIYSEKYLIGLHLAHLNQPNISFNKETQTKKEIAITLISALELDINPYGRGILPENTFFFGSLYGQLQGGTTRFVSSQELQLSNFSIGFFESLVRYKENSAMDLGLVSTIAFENFLFNLSYTFQSDSKTSNTPSIFEIGLRFSFDRFLSNRRGYYKRLNTDNL